MVRKKVTFKILSTLLILLHLNLYLIQSAHSFQAPTINLFPNVTPTQVTLVSGTNINVSVLDN